MIAVIDYGMGNVGSLENMIRKVGGQVKIVSSPEELDNARKLILPGVGHYDNAVRSLADLGLIEALKTKVIEEKLPILCICLGAQLVTESSEEGNLPGLGWIKGRTRRFHFENNSKLKIPHMGWNDVETKKNSVLFKNMPEEPCFYFVHSYHLICDNPDDVLTTTYYGYEFVSAIEHDNIYATQFHPEKSHKYGMKLIENFVEL